MTPVNVMSPTKKATKEHRTRCTSDGTFSLAWNKNIIIRLHDMTHLKTKLRVHLSEYCVNLELQQDMHGRAFVTNCPCL